MKMMMDSLYRPEQSTQSKLNMRQFFSINPDLIKHSPNLKDGIRSSRPLLQGNQLAHSTAHIYMLASDGKVIK